MTAKTALASHRAVKMLVYSALYNVNERRAFA